MRLKKGFTLAEILIVLMVIGVIATMTIPSMMKGVTEAQLKAGYKKAYNTIANFAAMERVAGNLPQKAAAEDIALLYQSLNSSLSVKEFAQQSINALSPLQNQGVHANCMTATINGQGGTVIGINEGTCIDSGDAFTDAAAGGIIAGSNDIWIVTEDNIAYTLTLGGGTQAVNGCQTKQAISAQADDAAASNASCVVVIVDVNGLSKGPNRLETQGLGAPAAGGAGGGGTMAIAPETTLETLVGDQYKIYLGSDGATAGPRIATVSGRIMADLR